MTEQFVAKYLRLSVEDGDVVSNDIKMESDSIAHQRELIKRYIYEKRICPAMQSLEFVDDGYSGTNFERPAIRRMLSMVREGRIGCIIVKDISRFGRNYLEVGDYLEQIFPFMGVRFIAINDGYDSNAHMGATGGIEIALKSFIYDMYSKDLSEKMRSSLAVRRKRGDFIGPRAPFGYRFSDDRKVLAVDDVAAQYVKKIFALACEGYGTGKIAKILNKEKIPTPGRYKNNNKFSQEDNHVIWKKQEKEQYHILDGEGYWDSGRVQKILQNKVYLGMIVNGKNRVTEIGGSHFRQVPDEERICVPHQHEAIISEQEFILASEVIRHNAHQNRNKPHPDLCECISFQGEARFRPIRYTPKQGSVLIGKLRCGHCKRSLVRINGMTVPSFTCRKAGYEEKSECIHERISELELESAILERIKQKWEQEYPKSLSGKQESVLPAISVLDKKQMKQRCKALGQKKDAIKIKKQYLYEQFRQNQIEREVYLKKVEVLRKEEKSLYDEIQRLQEEKDYGEENQNVQQKERRCIETVEKLTREVLEEWVDTIYVYGKTQLDIVYKNNDR